MSSRKKEIDHPTATKLQKPFTKAGFIAKLDTFIETANRLYDQRVKTKEFGRWYNDVDALLRHALGDDSKQVFDFTSIHYIPLIFGSDTGEDVFQAAYLGGLESAISLLSSICNEVSEYFADDCDNDDHAFEHEKGKEDNGKVFVVHGHDEELLLAVEKSLIALDLTPIILREQPNAGMTLIQKFEKNTEKACFVIFLLTADETSKIHRTGEEELHARQNVIFEMGYFFNAFRRNDGSHLGVFAILQEGVAKPGDVDGLVYHQYNKGNDSWKLALAKELQAAGVVFDASKIVLM